jgi:hypothetical protein
MAQKKDIKLDLRAEPDFITQCIGKLAVVCWIFTFLAIIIAIVALPVVRNLMNTALNLNLKPAWSQLLYYIDFYVLAAILVSSGLGLYFNSMRHRRRTDQYNVSLVYFLVLSALCMIGYLFFFQKIL